MSSLGPDKVGIIHFTMKDAEGEVLESTVGGGAFAYLHGTGNLPEGLEAALAGKAAGDHVEVRIEDCFGALSGVEPLKVKRKELPRDRDYKAGDGLPVELEDGQHIVLYVVEAKGSWVTLTRDHPLAGKTLSFEVDVVDVRDATATEKQHGHAHGHGGHEHH